MSTVQELIRRFQIDPKKSLGQNFLVDESYLAQIVAAANLAATDTVLEIGPGVGGLTRRLAEQVRRVVAVELDRRLIEQLRSMFAGQPQVTIVHGDILELDPATTARDGSSDAAPTPYKVVANLPYYITSHVLRHLLEASAPPTLAVLMVQKEVAERMCAAPGEMSLLAVSVQFYAQPQIVQIVPARAFYPRPKVDSAIVRLTLLPETVIPDADPPFFFSVVRAGFGQKRKQLLNSLSAGLQLPKTDVQTILAAAEIDPMRRAETLTLMEWGRLCAAVASNRTTPSLATAINTRHLTSDI